MQIFLAGKQARGRGLYSGFRVTGMIEGFLGLKFSIPVFFFVGKFGWLDLSRDFFGIQNNLKICARE